MVQPAPQQRFGVALALPSTPRSDRRHEQTRAAFAPPSGAIRQPHARFDL